jgi:hypothetical protein
VYEVIIMDDSLRKLLPDLVILIEIEGVQWFETATCERGFSLRTQILTAQRHSMGDSLLACLMMICSNGPSLHEKEEVEKFLLAVVARFKAFKRRVQSRGCGAHPQRASASKAKSSVLSQLSGNERERECCLLVLNSVTSTPQWIRQPEAAWGCVWCLCVSMYSDILGSLSL